MREGPFRRFSKARCNLAARPAGAIGSARSALGGAGRGGKGRPRLSGRYGPATVTETPSIPLSKSPGGSPLMRPIVVLAFADTNSAENFLQT
jgi:hypothetical protein